MVDLSVVDFRLTDSAHLGRHEARGPSVEELSARLRGLAATQESLVRVRQIGMSREGRALEVFSVGSGRQAVLVIGGPHPNEPVGYATINVLADVVTAHAELREGLSWHFLPCVDPDAAALNAGWTSLPLELLAQHRHFYRPAMAEQPEWTFPVPWGEGLHHFGLPENQALADLVDELRPAVAVSLHNAEFGDPFFVLSQAVPGLAQRLAAVSARHGLPVAQAAPSDVVGWPVLGRGVFQMPSVEQLVIRDHTHRAPAYGAHLAHYAARYGTVTLLPEVPRWYTGTRFDNAPSTELTALAQALTREADEVQQLMEQAVLPDGIFTRAARDTLAVSTTVARSWQQRAADPTPVSGAALAEAHFMRVMMTLRSAGMALRAANGARGGGSSVPAVRCRLDELLAERASHCARLLQPTPIELRRLVAVQADATLAAVGLVV
ncbi:M14 family zinc carboxypeptidase [Kitasatospora brasiliensis]|uniref:M14 family zinc carboxypeptidase n=1 Tax=Kitasatospora brasiliensis TaxID=3058040 RepID=UPI00292FC665|nr:M14 family zinc carboxypeptidase [Kitasatospora sp. K002]